MKKYFLYLFLVLGFSFLFTTNTKAFTVYSDDKYTIDEEFIYNTFKSTYEDFSFKEFPYVKCHYAHYSTDKRVYCIAIDKRFFDALIFYTEYPIPGTYFFKNNEVIASSIEFTYTLSTGELTSSVQLDKLRPYYSNSASSYEIHYKNTNYDNYTNYNPSLLPGLSSNYDTKINKLDFSIYSIDYSLSDKTIFSEDPNNNYREECFSGGTLFSVYPNKNNPELKQKKENNENEFNIYSGLYFFGNTVGLQRGTYKHLTLASGPLYQDMVTLTLGLKFSQLHNITTDFTLLENDDLLQIRYSDIKDALGDYDYVNDIQNSYFYDNLSKLTNTTYAPFTYYENVLGDYYFDMFYYNPKDKNSGVCMFIPKYFDVTFITLNEYGGMIADIETPGGTTNLLPTESIPGDNSTTGGLFSSVNNFISKISTPLELVNGYIYDFYNSMPFLLKLFIISAVTLLVTKFIIGLVIK